MPFEPFYAKLLRKLRAQKITTISCYGKRVPMFPLFKMSAARPKGKHGSDDLDKLSCCSSMLHTHLYLIVFIQINQSAQQSDRVA